MEHSKLYEKHLNKVMNHNYTDDNGFWRSDTERTAEACEKVTLEEMEGLLEWIAVQDFCPEADKMYHRLDSYTVSDRKPGSKQWEFKYTSLTIKELITLYLNREEHGTDNITD